MNRKRLFEIIEVGCGEDKTSKAYDFFSAIAIIINLIAAMAYTYEGIRSKIAVLLAVIEVITVLFFTLDYIFRVATADFLYDDYQPGQARIKYMLSFSGIIDLLSFLPFFFLGSFPVGAVAFRLLRVTRIFKLFRINIYYDAFNVITDVVSGKKLQLLSSVFIILVLMLASSLWMYNLEHEAQPEVFKNGFSGIWWAASTLLTVGYGDIYPVTTLGRLFGIIITFLGVGMVAIPTGIISAGFVEQYSMAKKGGEFGMTENLNSLRLRLAEGDSWIGKEIKELGLPLDSKLVAIRRGLDLIEPSDELVLAEGDIILMTSDDSAIMEQGDLSIFEIGPNNPWKGKMIKRLDISRKTTILEVHRGEKIFKPDGSFKFKQGDKVTVFTRV